MKTLSGVYQYLGKSVFKHDYMQQMISAKSNGPLQLNIQNSYQFDTFKPLVNNAAIHIFSFVLKKTRCFIELITSSFIILINSKNRSL